jgi:hypothetical protein
VRLSNFGESDIHRRAWVNPPVPIRVGREPIIPSIQTGVESGEQVTREPQAMHIDKPGDIEGAVARSILKLSKAYWNRHTTSRRCVYSSPSTAGVPYNTCSLAFLVSGWPPTIMLSLVW